MRSNGSVRGNRVYILDCQNARVEFRAYPSCLTQHGIRLLHPRAFGRILDGIGGGRADGPCQHAGHPPRRDRRLAHTLACGIGSVTFCAIVLSRHFLH